MKKVLLVLASVIVGLSAYAQGTVSFQNKDSATTPPINAPIFDVSLTGAKLAGTSAWAQLFAGPAGAAESALQPMGVAVNFRGTLPTDAAAGFVNVGSDASRAITGVPFGGVAVCQIRAWSANGGDTWDKAVAAGAKDDKVHYGASALLNITTAASALNTPSPLTGLASFAITSHAAVIPEPTTIALGLLGAAVLFIRRRQ